MKTKSFKSYLKKRLSKQEITEIKEQAALEVNLESILQQSIIQQQKFCNFAAMNNFPNIPEFEKEKKWFQVLKDIIRVRISQGDFLDSPLIQTLCSDGTNRTNNWKAIKLLIEYCFDNAQNVEQIFSITQEVKNDKDDKISDMFRELTAIILLKMFGFENIEYQKKGVDFIGYIHGEKWFIEITNLRGSGFKYQMKHEHRSSLTQNPVYKLDSRKLKNRLKSISNRENEQFDESMNSSNTLVIICANSLLETAPFWLDHQSQDGKHPIQLHVDNCERPTIVFGCGLSPYISCKLDRILLPFDRIKYLETMYGDSAQVLINNAIETQNKLEAIFQDSLNTDSKSFDE